MRRRRCRPPPKPLDEAWDPDRPTLDVYLTIPEYRPDGFNVASAQRDQSTRYRAELLMRRDENNGLAEKPVQVAKKNLRFLVEGESLDGSSALPIARVVRGQQVKPRSTRGSFHHCSTSVRASS